MGEKKEPVKVNEYNSFSFQTIMDSLYRMVDYPVTEFRQRIVVPRQQKSLWYHKKYRRVPTVDKCCEDDVVCDFEANCQFKRDRMVDCEILTILRQRFEDCMMYETPDFEAPCKYLWQRYRDGEEAWFIKYGDLGAYADARKAFMKQKHRMAYEKKNNVKLASKDKFL